MTRTGYDRVNISTTSRHVANVARLKPGKAVGNDSDEAACRDSFLNSSNRLQSPNSFLSPDGKYPRYYKRIFCLTRCSHARCKSISCDTSVP